MIRKKISKEIDTEECEHIIGIVLTNRKSFIKFSEISEKNIYAGVVIGQAFLRDISVLDDEFDALTLFYIWKILNSYDVTEEQFIEGANKVFDNCEINNELREFYGNRLRDYKNLNYIALGEKLLANIAEIYSGNVEKNEPEILAKQLKKFKSLLERNIYNELSA